MATTVHVELVPASTATTVAPRDVAGHPPNIAPQPAHVAPVAVAPGAPGTLGHGGEAHHMGHTGHHMGHGGPHATTFAPTVGPAVAAVPAVVAAPVVVVTPPIAVPVFRRLATFLMTISTALLLLAVTSNQMVIHDQVVGVTTLDRNVTLYRVSRGVWRTCYEAATAFPAFPATVPFGSAQCTSISRDSDCSHEYTVDSFGALPFGAPYRFGYPEGQCAKLNTIRAFLILSAMMAIFAVIAMKTASDSYARTAALGHTRTRFILAVVFALLAAIFGMIAMAVARNRYGDLPLHEYGYSFWALVIGWTLATIALILWILSDATKSANDRAQIGSDHSSIDNDRSYTYLAAATALLAFIFFIIAASTNEMVYWTRGIADYSDVSTGRLTYARQTLGLWRVCRGVIVSSNLQDRYAPVVVDNSCEDVNVSCDVDDGTTLGACRTLQTIRAMIIIAVIASFLAFVFKCLSHPIRDKKTWYHLAMAFSLIAAACGFIAMSLAISYYVERATHWGFSFWLTLLGWLFSLAALALLWWARSRTKQYFLAHVIRLLTWIALIFEITAICMSHWVYLDRLPGFGDQFMRYHPTLRPVQYGLWEMCFGGGTCSDISSDRHCSVDGMENLRDCGTFNGIRAAAILFALAIAVYIFVQWIIDHRICLQHERRRKIGRLVGLIFAIIALFWGIVGTALAVRYFDVTTTEYAYSFWLHLTAWLLILLTMFLYLAPVWHVSRYNEMFQFWLTLAALICFVLAAAYHEFVRHDYDASFVQVGGQVIQVPQGYEYSGAPLVPSGSSGNSTDGAPSLGYVWAGTNLTEADFRSNLTFTRSSISHGMFYTCSHTIMGRQCRVLNTECSTRTGDVMLPNCDKFNTLRAFTLLAIFFVGFSLIVRAINLFVKSHHASSLAGFLNFLAMIFALIAVAVGLNWVAHDLSRSSYWLGPAAALLIVGWLLTIRSVLAWDRQAVPHKNIHSRDGFYLC